jgi:hypothetical protein
MKGEREMERQITVEFKPGRMMGQNGDSHEHILRCLGDKLDGEYQGSGIFLGKTYKDSVRDIEFIFKNSDQADKFIGLAKRENFYICHDDFKIK